MVFSAGGVRLLQNDPSTPSSPSCALINAAHFPLPLLPWLQFGRNEGNQKHSGIARTPVPLLPPPCHSNPSIFLFCLMETLDLEGSRRHLRRPGDTVGTRRRFSAVRLGCASSQIPSHYLASTDREALPQTGAFSAKTRKGREDVRLFRILKIAALCG